MKNTTFYIILLGTMLIVSVLALNYISGESEKFKELYESKISVHRVDSTIIVQLKEELKTMKENRDFNFKQLGDCRDSEERRNKYDRGHFIPNNTIK